MKEKNPLHGPLEFLPPTLTAFLLTFIVAGCRSDLPLPGSHPLSLGATPADFIVQIEPEAPLEAAPRVLRAHLLWPEPIDKERVFLIRGEVSEYHLRQIERNDLSKTLVERIVPSMIWWENETDLVVAPTVVLEKGQTYSVTSGEPSKVVQFMVRTEDEPPLLSRVWPPPEMPTRLGIFCGDSPLSSLSLSTTLDPLGPHGTWRRGVAENGPGQTCLRFDFPTRLGGDGNDENGPWLLPPLLEVPEMPGIIMQIEPTPFSASEPLFDEMVPLDCEPDEISFGPGCAFVMDDRIAVRAPASELLWGIAGAGMDRVIKTTSKERFVIKELVPDSEIPLDLVVVDPFGRTFRQTIAVTTSSVSAHVVLNEVLANPNGPEPHQEWVELYNDGLVETSLLGYRILDIGGDTELPEVVLPPGQFAVVVNKTFVEDDEIDTPLAPDTIVVRVPSLGKNGLSNAGELLRLVDPEGRTISRFPALPKPKAGQTVSRRTPEASDGVSASFAITEPTPGLRNFAVSDP